MRIADCRLQIADYRAARIGLCVALVAMAGACRAADAGWVSISDGVLEKLAQEGKKPGWPGKTGGVAVDRTTGDVYLVVCDQGLWKSSDKGKTFERVDGGKVGGRCETGFAINMDPQGGRLMCFMVYGGCALSADAGKTWTASKVNHVDCGAVDWGASGKCMLTILHERNGKLMFSTDGAQSYKELGDGFKAVGLFDENTLLASKGDGILRSTDGGATWNKVCDTTPAGAVMQVFDGAGYWASAQGVLVTHDKGATWKVLGSPVNAFYGPYFGADEKDLVVAGKEGIFRTTDAGQTWKLVTPLPDGYPVGYTNLGWDPKAGILYASCMGKDTLKLELGQ